MAKYLILGLITAYFQMAFALPEDREEPIRISADSAIINEKGEIEYIFVNSLFRGQGVAKKLLKLTKKQVGKELIPQQPISPLGKKLFNIA